MIGARMNRVLGEIALGDIDLAASANAPSAADRIEIDAERARGLKQACAVGEFAPLAGGREDDAMGQAINRCNIIQSRIAPISESCPRRAGVQRSRPCEKPRCGGPGPPLSRG